MDDRIYKKDEMKKKKKNTLWHSFLSLHVSLASSECVQTIKNTASLYGREKKERKTLRNAAEQQKKNERDGKKGGKGGGHDSACWVFREPTKRAESIHTKKK